MAGRLIRVGGRREGGREGGKEGRREGEKEGGTKRSVFYSALHSPFSPSLPPSLPRLPVFMGQAILDALPPRTQAKPAEQVCLGREGLEQRIFCFDLGGDILEERGVRQGEREGGREGGREEGRKGGREEGRGGGREEGKVVATVSAVSRMSK